MPATVVLTAHALDRVMDRGITNEAVIDVARNSPISWAAPRGARAYGSPVAVGNRRDWLCVVCVDDGDRRVVLTAYLGPPGSRKGGDAA